MIDQLTIDKIKDAANVVDVIGEFYGLRKQGVNMTCICPFHQDRHIGSFIVSESKNMFTCYSCGAHGGPVDFLMMHEKMDFVEAIRWLGAKYGIEVGGAKNYHPKPATPHKPAPPLPMLILPKEYVTHSRQGIEENTLVKWLWSLPWDEAQRERLPKMLKNYQIGTAKQGHTMFWQIDEKMQPHTAKLIRYKPDGHRGKEKGDTNWVHAMLYKSHHLDPMEAQYETCYFGQHLLDVFPEATVNIVESEKTALICATAYGGMKKHIWVATGGLQFLNAQKMKPFIERGRQIVLYPDKDGIEKWQEKAREIGYEHLHVNTEVLNNYWTEADGPKADIADILVRLMQKSTRGKLEEMIQDNPAIQTLIETFGLETTK